MPVVSRDLPARPHLDVPKREARELLNAWKSADPDALDRIRRRHPKFQSLDDVAIRAATFRLSDAQLVIGREYGFAHWTELKQMIESHALTRTLERAIWANDRDAVVRMLREHPHLLHIPVRSGNWGPPMSHAANLGRLDIIQAVAALGARDFQHALDRALLQGQIECARWLLEHGGRLQPGIVMGACETLDQTGLRFLADHGVPFTDDKGNIMAPLALVLGTYCRNPEGKHAALNIFEELGYALPDTPMMAFHRGQIDRLKQHLARDPQLIERRFTYREIYPPELGCPDDGQLSGMHGTPIGGGTLLHLAIDFGEQDVLDLLLARGADVNAQVSVDSDGFGGHTPLFHCVVSHTHVSGHETNAGNARTLLARGARPGVRASLRKFLDWQEKPGWHEARDVTPAGWAEGFPHRSWVNEAALNLVKSAR